MTLASEPCLGQLGRFRVARPLKPFSILVNDPMVAMVLLAVKGLLPDQMAIQYEIARAKKQGYGRGYRDGQQSKTFQERKPRGIR